MTVAVIGIGVEAKKQFMEVLRMPMCIWKYAVEENMSKRAREKWARFIRLRRAFFGAE